MSDQQTSAAANRDAQFECGCWLSEVGAQRHPALTGTMCCPIHLKPYGENPARRAMPGRQSQAAGSTACDCIACRGELRDPPVRSAATDTDEALYYGLREADAARDAAASRRFPAREDGLFGGCPIYGEARSTGECEKCGGDLLACPVYGDGERKRQAEDRAAARVRHVTVDVYEDDKRVKQLSISYFDSQPYTVQIVTPDGVDAQAERTVGDA